ncbi:MAG: type IX secretion system membrane protein PorP/SprF [Ferruginibacter sp.]|nr:type IX secretion system membrane protein PorP/SprF [Cytophagales bacterium]
MLKPVRSFSFLLAVLLGASGLRAQDPQYSQFYAAPLYLSPAFAGSALAPRVVVNYRNQWPSLEASYVTYSASFDYYFPRAKSGVGLLVTRDVQGFGKFQNTDIGAQYAYQLELSDEWAFRAGLQASYVLRGLNYYGLTFGNQYTSKGFDPSRPGEPSNYENKGYVDLSSGGLLFSQRFYVGFSAHHMNRPNQSFTGDVSPLPMKSTITAGVNIPLDKKTKRGLKISKNEREVSFSPALLYKRQGKFSQLDAGAYFTYEPLVVGLWYRGIPLLKSSLEGLNNHDAAIFLVGFKNNNLSLGYSYDLTISSLTPSTGGSHEISIAYLFPQSPKRRKMPRSARRLPCPKF